MTSGSYKAVLSIGAFRHLWFAALFARVGEAVAQVALPLLVYRITGSAGLMSVIFVIQMAPRAILAPIAGLLADRLNRRNLMIWSSLGRAAGVVLLPFANEVWQVAAIAAFVAVGTTVVQPAELAAIPMTVGKADLVPALSITQVTGGITRIVGPAIGAGIVGIAGPRPAFFVQTACFLLAIVWLWRLVLPPSTSSAPVAASTATFFETARRDMMDGLRTVLHTPIIRGISAAEALWGLFNAVLTITTVVFTEKTLDLGDNAEVVYSLLAVALSVGAVLGALIASRVERSIGRPMLLAIGYLGPLMLVPVGLVPPLPFLFACWFALGFTDAWAVIALQAYLAESVSDGMRGRVYATWSGVISVSMVGAYALTGWMTDRFGPPATLALTGAIVGIGGPLLLQVTGALTQVKGWAAARVTFADSAVTSE